jgi:Small metal-binding protein
MKLMPFAQCAVLLIVASSSYAECSRLPKAIQHARYSLTSEPTNMGYGVPLLISYQSSALEHARASERLEKNAHTAEAIVYLEAAMGAARAGDNAQTHTHTIEAIKHLEMASECPQR